MAHQLSPENARKFWNAWKKLKLSEGKQHAFNRQRKTPHAPFKITPSTTAQGTTVYHVNVEPNNHNRQRALIGRTERNHYYKLLKELTKKYHLPESLNPFKYGTNMAESLRPIYGFNGLINRVKRAQQKRKKELELLESVRPHANKWRITTGTRKAEAMIQNIMAQKIRNIERKIAEVRKAPNGQAKNNARRNARYAINSFFGTSSNSNLKNRYLRNLNSA